MKTINPHKEKYFAMYMQMAIKASKQSVAVRRQVGCVIVLPSGLLSLGFNGTPSGFDNNCESKWFNTDGNTFLKTKPEVIHAERNSLDKLSREGVSPLGSILFTTTAPCIECAKSIHAVGITTVYYLDNYSCNKGINFLEVAGVKVHQFII
jgi:dCMP deaminase